MRKNILLTGGSGEVGYEAFKELFRNKDKFNIRVFSLDSKRERKLFNPHDGEIEIIWGDIRDKSDVRRAVKDIDCVLHIAALIPPMADDHPELAREINVGGTRNIIEAMLNDKNPGKLIYTSSISVYGDRVINPDIQVGDPLRPSIGDEYAKTKIEAEKLIQESGIEWTILRLCGILSPGLKVQPLMFHMPLDTSLEFCHNSDAGYALVKAVGCHALTNRIMNLGGGERCRITAREFLRKVLPIYGIDTDIIPDSAFATHNFHSGNYLDGDELDLLLSFRRMDLDDYFQNVRERVSPIQRKLVEAIPKFILRKFFLRMSEPIQAVKDNNMELIFRYYGSREAFVRLCKREGDFVFGGY